MPAELRKYQIKAARRPPVKFGLSPFVAVVDELGRKRYCHITFSDALVTAVGKKLPQGVSDWNMAFLSVIYNPLDKVWGVYASYFNKLDGYVLLWKTADKPPWLNIYGVNNDNKGKKAHPVNGGESPGGTRRVTQGRKSCT